MAGLALVPQPTEKETGTISQAEAAVDTREYGWLLRLWVLVVLFGAVTLARSFQVGIPPRDPGGAVLLFKTAASFGLLAVLAVLDALWRAGRQRWSRRAVLDGLSSRWTKRRLALAAGAMLAYHLVYFCYRNLKSWDVFNSERDDMLRRWDEWLFFGHSPAVLLHDLLGQQLTAHVLVVIYESFSIVVTLAVVSALVFVDRIRDGYVFVTAAIWVWILGVGSYYLIPSLGPFTSTPQDFASLPHTSIQDTQAKYLAQRVYLLAHPQAGDAFAQISAFASLHVAVTCMIVLMAHYYRLRALTIVLAGYLAGTLLATIYLGWHFVVDDVAGLAIAVVAVMLGRLMIYPRGRPAEQYAADRTSQ